MTARRRQRGFSLIEILVAFMILTMSMTVLFRIFSGGLRNVDLSADYARAVLLAESQLASAGIDTPLVRGETHGEWEERFRWHRQVESYQPWGRARELTVPLLAYRVTISVDWSHRGQPHRVELSSVRLIQAETVGDQG